MATVQDNMKIGAQAAASVTLALLDASRGLTGFGSIATLIIQLISVVDQFKCNKKAGKALQARFRHLAHHLFDGTSGMAALAQAMPNNASLDAYCTKMEDILNKGNNELTKFAKKGFIMALLKGSKPQELFERLDKDMTDTLNELSLVLHAAQLTEHSQTYEVVCNIQASIDQHGGLQGLAEDRVQLQQLAREIGADVEDLKADLSYALTGLADQVTVVDENVRDIKSMMHRVYQAVDEIQKNTSTKATDLSSLQLTSRPVVDRTHPLGVGAFGKVYKGTYNHMDVAVKEVTAIGSLTASQLKELSREVLMHSKVGNLPGVTRLFGANLTVEPRCIVLELADGSLHDALHKKSLGIEFSLSTKLSVAAQLCSAMAAISDLNILHRDIKSSNVLLFLHHNGRLLAKLSDFGLTKVVNESTMTMGGAATPKGTPPYMAPELFRGVYSSASDMYAFAVLLNELMSEQVPFPDCSYAQIVQSVGTFRKRPAVFKADGGDEVGRELRRLVARCWHQDPALRMSFHDVRKDLTHLLHKAFDGVRLGCHASPPAPPHEPADDSIAGLATWFTSCCHVDEPDAMALAHALVTVKRVTSQEVLAQVLHRHPYFLSRELHQSVVLEAQVCSVLGVRLVAATSAVKLESLTTDQLCSLFDHCCIADLKQVVVGNDLTGSDLECAIDCLADVAQFGLTDVKAKKLFKKVTEWKTKGLPSDFTVSASIVLPVSSPRTGAALVPVEAPAPVPTTPQSERPAIDMQLKVAADEGAAEAQFKLGCCFETGDGVEVDFAEAVWYYKLAAYQGNPDAIFRLAVSYENGTCVRANFAEAIQYYLRSAAQGNATAQYKVGELHENGKGVSLDMQEALRHYRSAAKQGYSDACGKLSHFEKRVKRFKLAADEGDADAQYNLGSCYFDGIGVSKDEDEARRHYRSAAIQGHANAQYTVATICYTDMDYAEAVKYFQLAADQGHAGAQYNLGECYYRGRGVSEDDAAAVKYWKLAAEQGNADAQYMLGFCYEVGMGVSVSEPDAVKFYKMAARAGDEHSLHKLAGCAVRNAEVSVDLAEALRQYKEVAGHDYTRVLRELAKYYVEVKDEIEAVRYLHLAADVGDATALTSLGKRLWRYNKAEAERYYKLAADQGNVHVQYKLACWFRGEEDGDRGHRMVADNAEAFKYYKLAAEQGDVGYYYGALAECYETGIGVSVSMTEAAKHYKAGADLYDYDSTYKMGLFYESGIGVSMNIAEAMKYYYTVVTYDYNPEMGGYSAYRLALYYDSGNASAVFCAAANWDEKIRHEGPDVAVDDRGYLSIWFYMKAAKWGNAQAQYFVACLYQNTPDDGDGDSNGDGDDDYECYYGCIRVSVNYAEAVKYYKLAADQGNASAQYGLGECYYGGEGVRVDRGEAVKYYKLAADQGNTSAQYRLGNCYYNGKGVNMDYAAAVKYYKLAADQGDAVAQYMLGHCYYKGEGVSDDYAEAVKYYKLAADQGNASAQYMLGYCYYNGKGVRVDYAMAVMYYQLAADQENADAQYELGGCYYDGKGVSMDYAEAVKYYQLVADQGYAEAQYKLGECFYNGKGVNVDYAEAVKYYKLAADQGNAAAQLNLGICYDNGDGVDVDYVEAVKYYKLAADQGHAGAQFKLGSCYYNGTGVSVDYVEAVNYYELAADQGNAAAQLNLGICYDNGQGVSVDYVEAAKYYKLAADQGDAYAQYMLVPAMRKVTG